MALDIWPDGSTSSSKVEVTGQSSRSQAGNNHWRKSIFGATATDGGGRGCAINSSILNVNLNMNIGVVQFFLFVGMISNEGFKAKFHYAI